MALNGYPVSRTLYKPPKSSSRISRKQLPFLLFSLLFTPINTLPMVSFTKLAVASMATLALAAPAPEEAGLIQMRQVVEAHFGGNSEIAKRFVDDAVALDARAAQDWISLFNVFQSFTNAGVSLFLNSIQALKNVSPSRPTLLSPRPSSRLRELSTSSSSGCRTTMDLLAGPRFSSTCSSPLA